MFTYHIHINGIVQGVGFRPMVYKLAELMQLKGYVKNTGDGVHIFFNATEPMALSFFDEIKLQAPAQATIISAKIKKISFTNFSSFSIVVETNDVAGKKVLLSPDISICDSCRREVNDKQNQRYRYPFITCTQCGPRYSLICGLPYERQGTTMQKFLMCESCQEEYDNMTDRRFFSQTNSCATCGIRLSMTVDACSKGEDTPENILLQIKNFLSQGKIVAVKGIGGYLLLCDAGSEGAIRVLRSRKQRPCKPFALLYDNLQRIERDFELTIREKLLITGNVCPVVLLYPRENAAGNLAVKDIAPGLKRLGVMLPCSPLLELIAGDYGRPLIATSGNISGSPIIYNDTDALSCLAGIADIIVSYNRDIIIPQDDSVVQVLKYSGHEIMLRRSRGYAPSFLQYAAKKLSTVFASGAFLKSSFTLSMNGNVFVSQYLGSGEGYESQQMYMDTLEHMMQLYAVIPGVILADMHPHYFSRQYAVGLAEKYHSEIRFIQHHEAHFAAVLAEHDLLDATETVLGIVWDGTGFGADGNIWGGEFFSYEANEMLRCYHFDYFPVIAGDKFAREPRIAALCATSDCWPQPPGLKKKFTDNEWNNYQALINSAALFSSSAGRIFDAVASLLDICDRQTYEGEAAMYLQCLAEEYVAEHGFTMDDAYFKEGSHYYRIPTATLMQGILTDLQKGCTKKYIAAKFHYSLVKLIDIVAKNLCVKKICFSGGVFQNALLVDWIVMMHNNAYQLYFHKNLAPNDENISFGQFVYFDTDIKTKKRIISPDKLQLMDDV